MPLDVVDLRSFYTTPLGSAARRFIGQVIRQRFANCCGQSILGVGYATPYLEPFRADSLRVLAFMPAEQGVVNWPSSGLSSSALVSPTMMPLPDACIDRVLLIHALELTEHPRELMAEIWRILTPGGRILAVTPSRTGLWARLDTTPFGHGQPYSRGQLRDLMRVTLFSPTRWTEALYMPPFQSRLVLRGAPMLERIGASLSLPGAGVQIVEATKQLYRPVILRQAMPQAIPQALPGLRPVLVPQAARTEKTSEAIAQ